MTVINPNSISGITSITLPSGGDNVLTIHTNDGVERFRIDSSGNVKVGSACTISPDGDVFFTGVCTATTLSGAASGLTGALPALDGSALTGVASTENIRTNTNATFLQNVNVSGSTTTGTTIVGGGVTISESGIEASGIGITCANINGTQIGGRRNIIINGSMLINERAQSSTSEGFVIDRMKILFNGTDEAPTHSQQSISSSDTGPYEAGFTKYLRIQNGNQTSGAGGADYILFRQTIEAQNLANSGWRSQSPTSFITLSYWVKSSVAQTFYANIQSVDGTSRNFPFSYALSADTWTKIIKTIPGNTSPTVDIDNDNGGGLYIDIWPFAGTNYTSSGVTLDTWATYSSGARFADNTTTWYTTNNATFDVTGMQLEVGPQATPFEHRTYAEELQLCKRYFQRFAGSGDHYMFGFTRAESNTARTGIVVPVPMRTAPTIACDGSRTFKNAAVSDSTDTPSVYDSSNFISNSSVYTIDFGGHSLSHNNIYLLMSNGTGGNELTLDSEL